MITLQTKVIPHPDVLATTLPNNEIVLLHLETQQYYTLNETGAQIWALLATNHSLAEIGQALETRYLITTEEAYPYVVELVNGLVEEKLVKVIGAT